MDLLAPLSFALKDVASGSETTKKRASCRKRSANYSLFMMFYSILNISDFNISVGMSLLYHAALYIMNY